MIFCKNCGYMLDDDARFCTECGTPTENAQNTTQNDPQNHNTQNNGYQNGYGQQNYYDPYNPYNPYDPYNPYYRPQPRKLNVGLLVFTIINFLLVGVLAVWPLVMLIKARNAHSDAEEALYLAKCQNANKVCLVIGIVLTVFDTILSTISILMM